MIKVGSDFSGVGAFNQALNRLGIEYQEIFACDMDKYARQTFIENYGEPGYFPTNVYEREIPTEPLEIYMSSPPCQAFSLAGQRLGKADTRGILFFNSLEFIRINKPRYFIFENVKGLLSDDSGKTFSEWVNFLGGKSVNGNTVMFPYEDSVPYHLYWKVLNAKNYGVPQNRERVFLIGIRDDSDNNFRFPIEMPLEKRLKDVLEPEVLTKFFLSEEAIKKCLKSEANKNMLIKEVSDISKCIVAGYYKIPFDGQYIKIESNLDKYYLSEKMIQYVNETGTKDFYYKPDFLDENSEITKPLTTCQNKRAGTTNYLVVKSNLEKYYLSEKLISGFIAHNERHKEKGTGFIFKPKNPESISNTIQAQYGKMSADSTYVQINENEIANCLRANGSINATDNTLLVKSATKDGFEQARDGDSLSLQQPNSETRRGRVGNQVAQTLDTGCQQAIVLFDYPKVKHKLSGGKWDKTHEQSRRVYDENGIAPTIHTCDGGNTKPKVAVTYNDKRLNETIEKNDLPDGEVKAIDTYNKKVQDNAPTLTEPHHNTTRLWDGFKIRRLTPRECFRLMDFPDSFKWSVSDTQAYKQAGNSIVVAVLYSILKNLDLEKK